MGCNSHPQSITMTASIHSDAIEEKLPDQHVETIDSESPYHPEYLEYSQGRTAKTFWRSILWAVAISFGAIFDCYAVIVPNNVIGNVAFVQQFGSVRGPTGAIIAINPNVLSNWSLVSLLGTIVGLSLGSTVGDRFGRKIAFWVLTVLLVVAVVLSLVAKNTLTWGARGVFAGLAQGVLQANLVPYLSEIAPPKIRGAFLSGYSFFWGMGSLVGAIALYAAEIIDPLNWKQVFYAQFVFLGLFIPAVVFIPESPWWLIRKGREAEAKKSMQKLYGNVAVYDIDKEYKSILTTIDKERHNASSDSGAEWRLYLDCFKGTNLRRTFVATIPIATQAFSGVILFYGYTVYFFQQAGYPKPFEASLIYNAIALVGLMGSFFTLDFFGRRPTLIGGSAICAVCCWALGGIGFMSTPNGVGLVSLACLWVFFYNLSLGPMGYNYVGEVPTQRLRSKVASIAFALYAAFNIVFAYIVPYMLSPLEWNWGIKSGTSVCTAPPIRR
jgi:sugar porter (SP) family MFS transporter